MIKLKHFHYIDGSGPDKTETNFLKEEEGFVNQDTINVMEMNHTFTHAPQKMLSVFVSYVEIEKKVKDCLLYTSPSPRDGLLSRMPSSA